MRKIPDVIQFKPAFDINPDILARYQANRLRVVRQVRYSLHNENSIDLVLFLNGIPVATVELKTDFTQSLGDAIDQYRYDRDPQPKGQNAEPLLDFPRGALVHFAVSNREVAMTTHLKGKATHFLPFNQGDKGGAGNPVNPDGHPTAYLWEKIWARESWLEILGRYLIAQRDDKRKIEKIIFPRYHQLDATRKLQAAVLADGAGAKYLIQHSAGSGKTNSIAWSAHFLSELHDARGDKVFDSVLVISDRNVIDKQLQEAIFGFQRQTGVVALVTNKESSKSAALAEALSGDKKIVVCTIQTFPFAIEEVRRLAATQGKRFAVIADEAHSSQTGEAAAKLKLVLSAEELDALKDGGEVGVDDILAAQMANRAAESGITYVAFTATPKAKTLEIFGTRPDPAKPAGEGNLPAPFHIYSMRQAIEEEFILDVLQNYTSYKLAFRLAHNGRDLDDKTVERSAALKGIMGWVRLHPYNIAQKVAIVVEHFRKTVAPLLNGKAKAMVVVGSRVEAVRWKLAVEKYITEHGYKIGALVAFSGEVNDPESGPDPLKETNAALNPNLKGRDIREAFKGDEYQILLVANKFQTGFDQPLLCGMYVDKRLDGIQAVQTLSRLNRAHPGKDTTYVLDFVNDAEEILAAFKTYYETATLSGVTDPNIVFDLRAKLDDARLYNENEIERVVAAELNPNSRQSDLVKAIEPVADRIVRTYKAFQDARKSALERNDEADAKKAKDGMDTLLLFRGDLGAYIRLYAFLSQIFNYENTGIEKRAIFYKRLLPLLKFERERDGLDLSSVVLTHHHLKNTGRRAMPLSNGETPTLDPVTGAGGGSVQEKQKVYLAELIEKLNELFGGEVTEQDKLSYVNGTLINKLTESETLRQQAASNTKEQFANSPDLMTEFKNAIIASYDAHTVMSSKALNQPDVLRSLLEILIDHAQLWERLRNKTA
ncbi:type I restriction enzyme R subunit [Ereboglobus sp. PH5-5]|uniref:type I restriction endonuclease subunit R n=1 Tax=Ereboglobus sp. PH5-5 TaxID=2940529 RepID=UPI002405CB4E|nr:type I restriction endonuclease [Ereboglobus sp. PH5-5]MDF9834436.1 type I restriction enzyme R subunit [Ereboglobus sp. PH5-5]